MMRRKLITLVSLAICAAGLAPAARGAEGPANVRNYHFDGTMSREVLENYLSRSITMEGLRQIGAQGAGRARPSGTGWATKV